MQTEINDSTSERESNENSKDTSNKPKLYVVVCCCVLLWLKSFVGRLFASPQKPCSLHLLTIPYRCYLINSTGMVCHPFGWNYFLICLQFPVDPNPPEPRFVSDKSSSDSKTVTLQTSNIHNCAILSPILIYRVVLE